MKKTNIKKEMSLIEYIMLWTIIFVMGLFIIMGVLNILRINKDTERVRRDTAHAMPYSEQTQDVTTQI